MSQAGKTLRLARIFDQRTNRTVTVSMDHGLFMGSVGGLEKPSEVAEKVLKGGANALIVSPGICRLIVSTIKGRAGLILRVDGATTVYGPEFSDTRIIANVEDAVRIGADAVIAMGYIGTEKESQTLENLGLIARECEKSGVPLVAEMVLARSERIADPYSTDTVCLAARVGAELGADIVKTLYTGSEDTFRAVVKGCPVPIVVAGGPKMESEENVLGVVRGAIDAGAVGVAFGRNVWQHENPEAMTRAIWKIVHEGSSVERVLKEMARDMAL